MVQEVETAEDRHAVRSLVKFAVLAGLVFVAGRFLAQKKSEYAGLTESEAKDKFVETVGPRIGDEAAEDIADSVIPKLKDRGLLKADPVDAAVDQVKGAAKDVGDKIADTAEDAVDQVKDASKDVADTVGDSAKKASAKAKAAAKDVSDKVSDAVDEVTKK
jgi:gas vesicle protein